MIPFDAAFAQRSARGVHRPTCSSSALQATHVSVGENFRFGHRAAGDTALLRADGRFETRVVPLVEVDGEIVSSSHIRGLVLAGEVEPRRPRSSARRSQMRGEVVNGDERGRELGFPTANLVPDEALVRPGHGIYAARASFDGTCACAAVNVGVRPDLRDRPRRAGRGLPARLRRRPLRPRAARSSSSRACAASGASTRPRR